MTFSGDIFLQMCLKRNPPKNVGTFRVLNLMFLLLLLLLFSRFLRCRHIVVMAARELASSIQTRKKKFCICDDFVELM